MIRIGKFRVGFLAGSMLVVFIVLSACAIYAAYRKSRPEWPMPYSTLVMINEGLAIGATLVYGIIVHLAIAAIDRFKRR